MYNFGQFNIGLNTAKPISVGMIIIYVQCVVLTALFVMRYCDTKLKETILNIALSFSTVGNKNALFLPNLLTKCEKILNNMLIQWENLKH